MKAVADPAIPTVKGRLRGAPIPTPSAVGLAGTRRLVGSSAVSAGGLRHAPPGPTAADAELLGAAQAVELAARDLYRAAIDAGADDDVYVGIRDNHQAYADVLSGLLGRAAPGRRDERPLRGGGGRLRAER